MHQNLFELSLSPIPEIERITENSLEIGDIPNADWWCDEENRDEAIRRLVSTLYTCCPGLVKANLKNGTIAFRAGFKQAWLRNKYETAQAIARNIARMSEKEFTDGGGFAVMKLKWAVDDEFGTYIYSHEDFYAMTLDQWVSENKLDGTMWYVGGIVDWHC